MYSERDRHRRRRELSEEIREMRRVEGSQSHPFGCVCRLCFDRWSAAEAQAKRELNQVRYLLFGRP